MVKAGDVGYEMCEIFRLEFMCSPFRNIWGRGKPRTPPTYIHHWWQGCFDSCALVWYDDGSHMVPPYYETCSGTNAIFILQKLCVNVGDILLHIRLMARVWHDWFND